MESLLIEYNNIKLLLNQQDKSKEMNNSLRLLRKNILI